MHARGPAQQADSTATPLDVNSPAVAVLKPLAAVASRRGLMPLADKLGELRTWMSDELHTLEQDLSRLDAAQQNNTGTEQAARHLLGLPGKRIRPLCVMLAARLGQAAAADVRALATACELVHAATLLHDDVVDHSAERRGAPAAHVLFGNSASILAGDHLLVHAMSLVYDSGEPALLGPLLGVMRQMVQAEALQLERRGSFVPSREAYLEVIRGKTASLFGWGLFAGATLAHLDAPLCEALKQVGVHLGMAFQLVDDVLDLTGDKETTGKSALQDVREGKLTWPLILASEADPSVLRDVTRAASLDGQWRPSELPGLLQRIEATEALEETRAFARREAHKASTMLASMPDSRARAALLLVVQAAVQRLY